MRVLLVDDDVVDREFINRKLLKHNDLDIQITEASSVDEGLVLYHNQHFDVILLDYRMPSRDGIEMLLELGNEPKTNSTAIIITSSSDDEELALSCLKAGAQDFLVKSEITTTRLRSAMLHAYTRFELEKQLYFETHCKTGNQVDRLTGLTDRYVFEESLRRELHHGLRAGYKVAVLLIDLDNFKYINDIYGHQVGDWLLQEVAKRVHGCLRGNELLARMGGDEFAIAISNLKIRKDIESILKRILQSLAIPFIISEFAIKTSASVGVAIYPENGKTTDELLKHADVALYQAKSLGRNRYSFFQKRMEEQLSRRHQIEKDLETAVENNELLLYFQPVINVENENVVGFEALVRWKFKEKIVPPDEFISIAEQSEAIWSIGRWIIREAIAVLGGWNALGYADYSMSINLSSVQFKDPELVSCIETCIETFNVPAFQVEFEITETALWRDLKESRRVIGKIRELGCRIALDDFGTGFSSISHLQKFPIDTVKIDKSLMPGSFDGSKDIAIIMGLVAMSKMLGIDVVAEGVETDAHLSLCKAAGITRIQGYLYSKPLCKDTIDELYIFAARSQETR